ncbi:MAG: hypothetical protein K5929_01195 [Lachnospiraceae bacterium]|nr:hypothetical protein [Lachnospiraceae bacterium]
MNQKKLDELLNNTPIIGYNNKDMEIYSNAESKYETEAIMRESDKNDPNRVKYRIYTLEQSMDNIRSAIFGHTISFRGYVTDAKGKLSEKKIQKFIEKMLDAYPQKDGLSAEKRRFIELFLYCAIVGPSCSTRYETIVFDYCVDISESFSDLIRAAKDPGLYINDPVKFASDEEYDSLMPEYAYGFLSSLNMAWHRLYEKSPDDYYTAEQKEAAAAVYEDMTGYDYETGRSLYEYEVEESVDKADEAGVLNASSATSSSDEDVSTASRIRFTDTDTDNEPSVYDEPPVFDEQSLYEDMTEEIYDFPEPDYESLEAEKQATIEYFVEKWSEYLGNLPPNHRLGKKYKEFRDMFFVTEHSDLAQIIMEMAESFLISEDLSPLCMGNEYGIIANTLEKSVHTISNKVKAAEDLSKKRNNI